MTWITDLPAFLLIVALLYIPGLLLCAAAGARRFLLIAAAPAATIAAMACLAIVFPFIHVPWSVPMALFGIAVVAIVVGAVRWLIVRRAAPADRASDAPDRPRMLHGGRWIALAMVIAAVTITVQLLIVFQVPWSISQTFDAIYHLNTLRYIQDTANASSLHVNQLVVPPGHAQFYPAAWHGFVSLAIELTRVSIPVGTNLANIAMAALIWPAAAIALTRELLPRSRAAVVATGVLCTAFPGFPLLMLTYGVLYPYFLSLALLPLALALGISAIGAPHASPHRGVRLVLLAATLIAIALAQPSVVFAWFAFLIPLLIARVIAFVRGRPSRRVAVLTWGIVAVVLIVFALAWVAVGQLGANTPWRAYTNPFDGVVEAIAFTKQGAPIAIVLAVLAVAGIVHLIRNPGRRWYLATWGIGVAMFVVSAALPSWKLRAYLVGLFYRDPPRLYALLVIVALPMAVFGAVALWRFARGRILAARQAGQRRTVVRVAGAVAVLVLFAGTQNAPVWSAVIGAASTYAMTPTAPLLSNDERTLIERVPSEIPHGVRVAGNPWTGTAFLYALTGQPVLTPHFSAVIDAQAPIINLKLNEARTDPKVCEAVRALNVGYVLDFGTYLQDAGKSGITIDSRVGFEGLYDLVQDGVAVEVDHQGPAAKLLKITACP